MSLNVLNPDYGFKTNWLQNKTTLYRHSDNDNNSYFHDDNAYNDDDIKTNNDNDNANDNTNDNSYNFIVLYLTCI